MSLGDILRRLRKSEPADRRAPPVGRAPGPTGYYHAVAVVAGSNACKTALALRDMRVLSRDAPPIPLPDCTNPEGCTCRFAKFNDRRQDDRRDILSLSRWYPGQERRRTSGRRASDR